PVTHATLASRAISDATLEGPFTLPAASLVAGTNWLAVEVHQRATDSSDIVFGLELSERRILGTVTNAPGAALLPLAFNEISQASDALFWLEIINTGDSPVDLAGVQVVRSGGGLSYEFPSQALLPGRLAMVPQAQLDFGAAASDKLFLFAAGGSNLLDAVTVSANLRARRPDGDGEWMTPSLPSPGTSNVVFVNRDVVINEVMFHYPPSDASPAVTSNFNVIEITGPWRYEDSGTALGTTWREPGYDDRSWSMGTGVFAFNASGLPAPVNTPLVRDHATHYFRTRFNFGGGTNLSLSLRTIVDDGAVFYLNGVELHRQGMPPGAITHATSASVAVGDAQYVETLDLLADALVLGENVLAVEVHQATAPTTAGGIVLSGGGLTLVEEGPFGGAVPMNLARQPGAAPLVIDSLADFPIHNVAGLTDGVYGNNNSWIGNSGSPGYAGVRFGGLFTISSVAFGRDNLGTYSDRTLGHYTLQYTRVASPGTSTTATSNPDTGWANIGTLNYQGSGTGLFTAPSRRHRFTFTPVMATGIRLLVPATGLGSGTCIDELEVNPPDTSGDIAFGAELALTTTLAPARPYTESDEEWVELYNRGTNAMDLTGWRLDGAIDFRFTNGPVVPAGGYVVVARHATVLRAKWPAVAASITGNFAGRLRGFERFLLRDAAGNPVSETRVFEDGWSDGCGSSLELRDPKADTDTPDAWADSDETGRSAWQPVSYRMVAGQTYGSTRWNEFRLGLLDKGVILIDDVSVVRDPDGARVELIENGNFEITSGNTHWRFLGHHRGEFVPDPDNAANQVLKLSAGGRAVMNHNHAESTFVNNTPIVNGQLYEVSYRARWQAGSPQVSTHAYFSKLAKVTTIALPPRAGTPGAPNSRRVANAGPTFTGLKHSPVIPASNQPIAISVRSSDPEGVVSATLNYRINPAVAFTTLPMTLDSDGVWTAEIPGQTAGRVVHFYVTAVDELGASATAPPNGQDSRALCQVADAQRTSLPAHELRLIMLDADRDFLFRPTNVMSNARLGGTLIYDRTEVFYDVGPRLQGTAASRIRDGDNYVSYDIAFPPGQLFRGVQNNVGIDRSGRGPVVRQQDEIYVLHMFHRAAVPIPYSDLCYFISPRTVHTGTAILQLAGYGRGFLREQYGEVGSVFNMDITYEPDTTVTASNVESPKLPVPHQAHIGTDFTDLGDKEQYRSPFDIRLENRRDDYEGLMRLCRAMALPQAQFDAQIGQVLNVDEALRMAAMEILCGIQDTYISSGASLPHNLRLITFANGDPAQLLPWDMDFVFGAATSSSVFLYSGVNLGKLLNHPATRRLYLHHLHDLCQTAFNADYMTPWLAHYGSVVGQNFSAAASYISSRRAYALTQLPAVVPFAITSNRGNDFAVNSNAVALVGTGWIDIRAVEVNGVPYAVNWTSVTNWSLRIPLAAGANELRVQAVDQAGNRRTNLADTISVTNRGPASLLPVVINEWMADNAGPGGLADPADGLFQDWFELFNPNATPVDLRGYFLTDDLANPTKFSIPTNTVIAGRGFLLVWADENGSQNSPTNADLHANFKLTGSGETLGIFAPDGFSPQHTVVFGPQFENVSQGLFPDGAIGSIHFMTNWTPRAANRLDLPASPEITAFAVEAGRVTLTVSAIPGRSYRLEYKDDLNAPAWIPLGTVRTAASPILTLTEPVGPEPLRFFRVRLD
ncbi:MAG: lamin tail domain-containing protein, partial [Verrucomicrobia bacterium]|nr:lamin tail domain-containing protein [Verrucomicrobiota bacterium]